MSTGINVRKADGSWAQTEAVEEGGVGVGFDVVLNLLRITAAITDLLAPGTDEMQSAKGLDLAGQGGGLHESGVRGIEGREQCGVEASRQKVICQNILF